jgi:hypothetical protein
MKKRDTLVNRGINNIMNWWKTSSRESDRDRAYLDAVARGDMALAQEMVNSAAKAAYENELETVRREYGALREMNFPFKADFNFEEVNVLGSIDSFHPYKI